MGDRGREREIERRQRGDRELDREREGERDRKRGREGDFRFCCSHTDQRMR